VTWQFVLTGFLIGTLVGLTGMGSGSLMTPILVIIFGFKPTVRGAPQPSRSRRPGLRLQ
jgi:uncharacterized membrane protein YfcA